VKIKLNVKWPFKTFDPSSPRIPREYPHKPYINCQKLQSLRYIFAADSMYLIIRVTHTPTVHQRHGQTDRQTDGRTDDFLYSASRSKNTRRRLRAEPSLQLGPCAYAAENQRAGKTRRRSIYSADILTRDTTYQPDGQPAKVTVPSCKLGNN